MEGIVDVVACTFCFFLIQSTIPLKNMVSHVTETEFFRRTWKKIKENDEALTLTRHHQWRQKS